MEKIIIAYRQYGNWYTTCPFDTIKQAEKHADMYLRGEGNAHKECVQFIGIELKE